MAQRPLDYEGRRRSKLKHLYRLTPEQYDEMLVDQEGKCLICTDALVSGKMDVDHDHVTKKVRGILCHPCNLALGIFRDNPETLERGAVYLRTYKETLHAVA